ncbi:MAG: hypothetical protein WBQ94_28245 [Terracidiphilus sp.]
MRLACLFAVVLNSLMGLWSQAQSPAPNPWEQPAAALAEQVAGIVGPGQAHLTIRNLSTVPAEQIATIRRLLVEDLKAHGVLASGAESANSIRITLSENARERIWVAEIVEGDETRVTMVHVDSGAAQHPQSTTGLMLRKQSILATHDPVLAVLEASNGLVAVEPEEIVIFDHRSVGWHEGKHVGIGQTKPLTRDPRAVIFPSPDGSGFEAFTAGSACIGNYQAEQSSSDWIVRCRESDDPWPITPSNTTNNSAAIKAFYNAGRNYFTGVITPNLNLDLPPFYTAVQIPRTSGTALLIGGIDGKVQLLETVPQKTVAGARDWGSDFAALRTGCGTGTQIIASGSGTAPNDSLRAYELPAQEAIPVSSPLAMDGAVTALAASPDGKSLIAIVRTATNEYEVDRVTASCN